MFHSPPFLHGHLQFVHTVWPLSDLKSRTSTLPQHVAFFEGLVWLLSARQLFTVAVITAQSNPVR